MRLMGKKVIPDDLLSSNYIFSSQGPLVINIKIISLTKVLFISVPYVQL